MPTMPRGGARKGAGRKADPNEGPRKFSIQCLTESERAELLKRLDEIRREKEEAKPKETS